MRYRLLSLLFLSFHLIGLPFAFRCGASLCTHCYTGASTGTHWFCRAVRLWCVACEYAFLACVFRERQTSFLHVRFVRVLCTLVFFFSACSLILVHVHTGSPPSAATSSTPPPAATAAAAPAAANVTRPADNDDDDDEPGSDSDDDDDGPPQPQPLQQQPQQQQTTQPQRQQTQPQQAKGAHGKQPPVKLAFGTAIAFSVSVGVGDGRLKRAVFDRIVGTRLHMSISFRIFSTYPSCYPSCMRHRFALCSRRDLRLRDWCRRTASVLPLCR